MRRLFLAFLLIYGLRGLATAAPTPDQLLTAYSYAYNLYASQHYDQARDIFKKLVILTPNQPGLNADALYYYSQCAFRTEDYDGCVKALYILAKRWPQSDPVAKGFVSRFCYFLIGQVTQIQTAWDYFRYPDGTDDDGKPVWKESVPPGFKVKRINFKLGFGLYRVMSILAPKDPQTAQAKQQLTAMMNAPITVLWRDEMAPKNRYGHPPDFLSYFNTDEKKAFGEVICERMFYNWKSDKFSQFFDMYDDVRNLKPCFIAQTKQDDDDSDQSASAPAAAPPTVTAATAAPPVPGAVPATAASPAATVAPEQAYVDLTDVLTLAHMFQVTGYNPFTDSFTNNLEDSPSDLML